MADPISTSASESVERPAIPLSQVATHTSKDDLYVVIDRKVYNVSKFIDEHPGGEEVILDAGGQDATEAFNDVGHSDEAREILEKYLIADLEQTQEEKAAWEAKSAVRGGDSSASSSSIMSISNILSLCGALVMAYIAYILTVSQS